MAIFDLRTATSHLLHARNPEMDARKAQGDGSEKPSGFKIDRGSIGFVNASAKLSSEGQKQRLARWSFTDRYLIPM